MRRWLLRISIIFAILIVVVIAIVQVVMWSPLPKRIVLQQIEKGLGLRISADALSTGWLGKSELTNVSIGLPLSDSDFLKVKSLKIQLNNLISLALGNVVVKSIEVDDPMVEVIQDAQGKWNLQQVAELLGKLGGSDNTQQQAASTSVPKLPMIKLIDGSVHITDNQKHTAALAPLNVTGQPDGPLVWKYDLSIADSIALSGQVAPGGNWQHQVALSINHLDSLLKDWGVPTTYGATVQASWQGQLSDGKVIGTLALIQATANHVPTLGDISVGGSVDVQTAGAVITLHPNNLNVHTSYVTLPDVGIQSGAIVSDATGIHAQSVKIKALGGLANVDGKIDPKAGSVDLQANWSGLSLASKTMQSGSMVATLRQPFANQPTIDVKLTDTGTIGSLASDAVSPLSRWNATVELTGQGSSWKSIDWILTTPQLSYTTGQNVVSLSGLNAHVTQRLPVVELTSLALPISNVTADQTSANLISHGLIDFAQNHWSFDATGGFNTAVQDTPVPVTVALQCSGNDTRYDLKQFKFGIGDLTMTADGSYDRSNPTPVDLHVQLAQAPQLALDAPVKGTLSGDFKIVGALFEEHSHFRPYLTTTGDLRSSDLVILDRPIGDMDIQLQGITSAPKLSNGDFGPPITQIQTTEFSLFQATWNFSAHYPNEKGEMEATLRTHRLPLTELAKFAKITGVTGTLTDASWKLTAHSLGLNAIDMRSEYHLANLAGPGVTVESVDAVTTLHNGVLQLNPLVAKNGNGSLLTTASIDLRNPQHLVTQTTVDKWPYPISGAVSATVSAHTALDVNLKSNHIGASGTLTAATDVLLDTTKLAHLETSATISNRSIDLDTLKGNILTGKFTGSATLNFDKPLQATGQIYWQDVDAATFATIFPAAEGLGGKFSGAITLGPARDPRPLEPVRVDINVASTGGHYRGLKIGGDRLLMMHAIGYLNTDRAVLDRSDIYIAGGVMHLWSRLQLRPDVGLTSQASIDFQNLQLDQLAHIDPKINQSIPGVLDGHIGVIRAGTDSSKVIGSAHFNLTQTDLANFGPLAALYNLMHVGSDGTAGRGTVDAAFEQNTLRITAFRYFNRGTDADGICAVGPLNFSDFLLTPVSGQVVGTPRAFKDTKLPLLGDFDQLFSAFAANLTTIDINGNLGAPKYQQGLVSEVGKTLQQLIVGDARAGQQSNSQ